MAERRHSLPRAFPPRCEFEAAARNGIDDAERFVGGQIRGLTTPMVPRRPQSSGSSNMAKYPTALSSHAVLSETRELCAAPRRARSAT